MDIFKYEEPGLPLVQLVGDGKLKWDEPVTEAWPDFRLGDADITRQVPREALTIGDAHQRRVINAFRPRRRDCRGHPVYPALC